MAKTADGGFLENISNKRPYIQCLRGALLMSELIIFAMALRYLGLAEVTAIFQSYLLAQFLRF